MAGFDILSDLFQTVRLRSDVYFTAQFARGYSVEIPPEGKRIRFHLVRDGACWLSHSDGSEPVQLRSGDLVLVANGAGHVLAHTKGLKPAALSDVLSTGAMDRQTGVLTYGTGAPTVTVLCGFCAFDEDIRHPLFASLPDRILLTSNEMVSQPATGTAISLIAEEADLAMAGTSGILSRLIEIVFVQSIRQLGDADQTDTVRFLTALADQKISKALRAMHMQPERPWTLAWLAEEAGMSRTRFSVKFSSMVGEPPMTYLANWRLAKSRVMLCDSSLAIDEIARRCGYQSLPAFTRRFKSAFGIGPGLFRRNLRSSLAIADRSAETGPS